ncbi:MAG: hypothetical protein ACREQ9_14340 [Candidatus Binatia bacterium]
MKVGAFLGGIVFLTSFGAAPAANAFEAEAQVHESDLIITGRVLSVTAERDEVTGEPFLRADVDIHDVWKGFPDAEEIAVRTPAGALANPGLALEGSARFQTGESVLLFLTRVGDDYRPWKTLFGKYAIRGAGDEARLVGNLPPVAADPADPMSIALDELRREIDVIVAREVGSGRLDVALRSGRRD